MAVRFALTRATHLRDTGTVILLFGIRNSGLTGRIIKIRQGVLTVYTSCLLHAPPALTYLLLGRISKYQTKLSPDGNGCQTLRLHYREEAQIKHFGAVGQHHERQ